MSEGEGEGESVKARRLRGLVSLVVDAVEHGSRAVERLHLGTTQRTFDVLEALPVVETPARVVHAVHDVSVRGVYGAIRLVNKGVGAAVDLGIQMAGAGLDAPRDAAAGDRAPDDDAATTERVPPAGETPARGDGAAADDESAHPREPPR